MIKNKKGVVLDTLTIVLVVFAFAFVSITVYYGFMSAEAEFRADLNDSSNLAVNESLASLDVVKNDFPGVFDGALLIVFIGLWMFALVSAWFIDTHPIFFILSFVLLIAVFVVAAVVQNAGEELLAEQEYQSVISGFPITSWLLSHFLVVVLVVGFSVLIVMFGKGRGAG